MPEPQQALVARVVWGAMMLAIAVYYLVVLLLPSPESPRDPIAVAMVHSAFVAVSAVQTLVIWFLYRRWLAPATQRGPAGAAIDPRRAFTVLVVCWGLGESIALFGLIVGMIGHPTPLFFVWGAAVLVVLRPRTDYFAGAASVSSQPR